MLPKLEEGVILPGISKTISQANINRYAEASGDFNPIHIDEDYARKTPLGGTVAHGMMVLAYVSRMMTSAFGTDWLSGGKLDVRFRAPARPGDTMDTGGKITAVERVENQTQVTCEVFCRNQDGESVITGVAQVMCSDRGVRTDEDSR